MAFNLFINDNDESFKNFKDADKLSLRSLNFLILSDFFPGMVMQEHATDQLNQSRRLEGTKFEHTPWLF